jgi:xanthine dehydrogenase accessory factor
LRAGSAADPRSPGVARELPDRPADGVAPAGGLRGILAGLRALAARGEPGVLAVVVGTRGSTYRKPGALVLLDAHGVRAGALSGGCLEEDLEHHARAVLAAGTAAAVTFATGGEEDRVFGSGTGCGGSTRVRLLPLPPSRAPLRDALLAADARGVPLRLALDEDGPHAGGGSATPLGTCEKYRFDPRGHPAPVAAEPACPLVLALACAPRVLLLGAGPETPALLRHGRGLGWHLELLERRRRWTRFVADGADAVHVEGDAAERLANRRFDAALVMHHHLDLDARALSALAPCAVPFVGLLGPAARRDALLREIGAAAAGALAPRLHAPVGLRLGGEGPEAIALSIVAELQQHLAAQAAA